MEWFAKDKGVSFKEVCEPTLPDELVDRSTNNQYQDISANRGYMDFLKFLPRRSYMRHQQ